MESRQPNLLCIIPDKYKNVVRELLARKNSRISDAVPRPQSHCDPKDEVTPDITFLTYLVDELNLKNLDQDSLNFLWRTDLAAISRDLLVYMLAKAVLNDERYKADKILKLDAMLAFQPCPNVTDYSGKQFIDHSPWELCLVTLNTWYMANIILSNITTDIEQITAIEQLEASKLRANYNPQSLFARMREYSTQENWSRVKRRQFWCNQVGHEQMLLPAHFARHLCSGDEAFEFLNYNNSNPNTFFNKAMRRQMQQFKVDESIKVYYWLESRYIPFYPEDNEALKLGRDFAVIRSGTASMLNIWGIGAVGSLTPEPSQGDVLRDLIILTGIYEKRLSDLSVIEMQLRKPLQKPSCCIS